MSLENELCKLVDEYINEFIKNITNQYEITEQELKDIRNTSKNKGSMF